MPFPFFLLGDTDLSRRGSPLLGAGGGGGVLLGPTLGSATLWTVGPGSPQEEPLETALGAVAFRPLVPDGCGLFSLSRPAASSFLLPFGVGSPAGSGPPPPGFVVVGFWEPLLFALGFLVGRPAAWEPTATAGLSLAGPIAAFAGGAEPTV